MAVQGELRILSLDIVGLPEGWPPTSGITDAAGVFLGYLALDLIIGNTDRHHENWGILVGNGPKDAWLAPSFDHAASLGQILRDEERQRRLSTRDTRQDVQAWARRARSALYAGPEDDRPLSTADAFTSGCKRRRVEANVWADRADAIAQGTVDALVSTIPATRMSDVAKRFAVALILANLRNLREAGVRGGDLA